MPLTNAVPTWTLVMPQGSAQLWNFVFTEVASGDPFPISGSTWEYVVRSASGVSAPLVFMLTTTVTIYGVLTVTETSSLSQVQMDMYPDATSSLAPGAYYHALWMNPGTTGAYSWFLGLLQVEASPGP